MHRITIFRDDHAYKIECDDRETILEAMLRQGLYSRSDCGGIGTCGKCGVQIISGNLAVTSQDKVFLTENELQDGYRLACMAVPDEDVAVLSGSASGQEIKGVTGIKLDMPGRQGIARRRDVHDDQDIADSCDTHDSRDAFDIRDIADISNRRLEGHYAIGIDLGTTTLAFQLVECSKAVTLATHTSMNPQRTYGADVVSRIKAAVGGRAEQLKEMLRCALEEGITDVLREARLDADQLSRIAIAGNTTMIHLLMGYPCDGLGTYPFTPVTVDTIRITAGEVLPNLSTRNIPVTIFPGISAFVGGDIVAGLGVCGYPSAAPVSLLIDFGTNGEIALGNQNRLLVTSTAAGPAFEGGNISCGVGGIPGAISHVSIKENKIGENKTDKEMICGNITGENRIGGNMPEIETIGDKPAIGICGTGAVELVAELYRVGIIGETGLLREEYFEAGFPLASMGEKTILFTQKDIRELQMAKAAIRAGIEVLLLRYGIDYNRVDKVYLAGGFGFYLDVDKAIRIGLLPGEFRNKVLAVGNSSLAGAVLSTTDPGFIPRIEPLIAKASEVHLSNDEAFQELYLNYMYL